MRSLRFTVHSRLDHSAEQSLRKSFESLGLVTDFQLAKVYWLIEKTDGAFLDLKLTEKLDKIFYDPISEDLQKGWPEVKGQENFVEIRFLAGVTDNWARSATEALALLSSDPHQPWQNFPVEVHSGWQILIQGDFSKNQIEEVLYQGFANPLLHKLEITGGLHSESLKRLESFESFWLAEQGGDLELKLFPLEFAALEKINQERGLAFNDQEIATIISYYSSAEQKARRQKNGWDGWVTEVELECLAQTWSEHCKHKIFAAEVEYSEENSEGNLHATPSLGNKKITSLYKSYIQKATNELESCGYLVSVFKDNAGIVDFDENINICVKVETHNSPSALDPFGGAITGILGVNRDILGCGIGAKPIANMDVFCLSEKNLFPAKDSVDRPVLLKDPSVIFRGVHAGVEEGGNQSGIPTVNGGFYFASNFGAKPLVFVGSVGVIPKIIGGLPTELKQIEVGDKIVVAGGRLGKDGVHGATFSSLELHDNVASNVVQIGDSITQKKLLDFTLQARDLNLIRALTDNGAGGVSSSIGEMATLCGGARLDLALHPLKYPGLEYWEMLISESQERMSYAVAPENLERFLTLAHKMGVEATCLGEFTQSGHFEVMHGEKPLALLNLHFLHEGLSRMQLQAHFSGPQSENEFYRACPKKILGPANAERVGEVLEVILASANVASREPLVRYYDHEVQGATRVKPYGGKTQQGASDAGVLELSMHGGAEFNGVAVSNGLCPQFSHYDTYLMAQRAVDEAVRNLVATGANPAKMALVDNFCWPDPTPKKSNPDASHKMAQLVRACEGLYTAAKVYEAPLVSGKDSMKNDFIGKTQGGETVKISVPPTLLMTAIAQVPDTRKVIQSYFQKPGDLIYLLGRPTESLFGSVLSQEFQISVTPPEYPNLKDNKKLYSQIFKASALLASCHDVSDGGMMSALSEACFGNWLGADLDLSQCSWENLWSETGSQFVVSVSAENKESFEALFRDYAFKIGQVTATETLKWKFATQTVQKDLKALHKGWSEGVRHVYES